MVINKQEFYVNGLLYRRSAIDKDAADLSEYKLLIDRDGEFG